MFIAPQPMKHDAYPLDPGKKGSSVSCQIWSPMATSPPRTAVQPATCQSRVSFSRKRRSPNCTRRALATLTAKMAAPAAVGAVTPLGRQRLLVVGRAQVEVREGQGGEGEGPDPDQEAAARPEGSLLGSEPRTRSPPASPSVGRRLSKGWLSTGFCAITYALTASGVVGRRRRPVCSSVGSTEPAGARRLTGPGPDLPPGRHRPRRSGTGRS